jgi:hypothetical protein
MEQVRGRRGFSLSYLFASFFGALMVASAFAYYNYRFAQFKFIDFNEWVFYEKSTLFTPQEPNYTVVVFSSNQTALDEILLKVKSKYPILAIDLYQHRDKRDDGIIQISAGMNTLLPFVQRFNIYEIPAVFTITKNKETLYKQDSLIQVLN